MLRRPPDSTRTDALSPNSTLFRSDFRVPAVVDARAGGEAIHEVALPCIGVEFVADRLFRPLEGCGAKSIAGDRVDVVDDLIRAFTESHHSGKELAGEFGLADRAIGNERKLFRRKTAEDGRASCREREGKRG